MVTQPKRIMNTHPIAVRFFLIISLICLGWTGGAVAGPSSAEDRAREFTHTGNAHYEAGRYAEAEAAFREAYALSGRSGFLWNMAQCARLGGAGRRALSLYREYLRVSPEASQRAEAERWISMLEAHLKGSGATQPSPGSPSKSGPQKPAQRRVVLLPPAKQQEDGAVPSLYERWWFWVGAGAVVSGVVTAIVVSSTSDSSQPPAPEPGAIRW